MISYVPRSGGSSSGVGAMNGVGAARLLGTALLSAAGIVQGRITVPGRTVRRVHGKGLDGLWHILHPCLDQSRAVCV